VAQRKTARTTKTRRKTSAKPAAARGKRAAGRARKTAGAARSRNAARGAASRSTKRSKQAPKPSTAAKAKATVTGAVKNAVAKVAKRLPGAELDALTLLEQDHRSLEDLLKRGESTTERASKQRKALLGAIATELTVHEMIEERLLYPFLEQYPETRAIVLEGVEEHHVADVILKELQDTPVTDEQWAAKFKVFKENLEHHIEEEEGPMFRTARGVAGHDALVALGRKMAAMKRAAIS
jgi:hypothetical protein